MIDLSTRDIKFLQGVGPQRAAVLNKELGICSFKNLLYYFPYKYVDRSRLYLIREIDGNMPYIQLRGRILSFETFGEGRQRRLVGHFTDGTGVIDLVWFQGLKYIEGKYKANEEYIVFGKPTVFSGRINVAHPDIDPAADLKLSEMGLEPYYNTTEKMKRHSLNSHAVQKLMKNLFALLKEDAFDETLSPSLVAAYHLMPLTDALHNIHFPRNPEFLRKARYRLKFEELFYVQLNILRYTKERRNKFRGLVFGRVGEIFNTFYSKNLPFELTGAQKRVIKEMRQDMRSGRQMNRLLQGDVGSGKTLVALMTMLIALDNGYQACMMAPTEILATQHYETITRFLAGMDVRVELLTGSIKGKRRETVLRDLLTGDVHILIGTHAVIEDTVGFSSLGLVVIDEQHRFGVAQRAKLWAKNVSPPHVLVMTATPIPRTLAMTLYGDLDVSVIDELPPGRKPIQTVHQFDNRRASMYAFMRKQIQEGRQVYVVYPLIQESEKMDIKNLEDGYLHICEAFPEYKVSKVHGKMKPVEKDEEMQRFLRNETQIMVATTVIEVGVNVPNASVMVIENAERFGLSQLHQLRGRVGRGADQSYCILVTGYKLTEDTRKRIEIMVQTNDGFEIAEADLKLRGPGDLEGTQQSGVAFDLKVADIAKDGQLLQYVRDIAERLLDSDPNGERPENAIVWRQLRELRKKNVNWSVIS
ncbi:ATP-dependent DNA helicase RecG [Bacteroides gallinaceum]|uniref:ATP-dependent DNA helicase RecG n=1 Tax=Bacteroides gallinaceum TaxID=1462571 RepID=A0ABT7VCW3_9BACE|nr:ATP-dependent DNA helicase RecG [Bacteroides gallinaceum]MDM8324138.1 ATP-dependent DNA helicase RecG [Bacteroides gallinaceum]